MRSILAITASYLLVATAMADGSQNADAAKEYSHCAAFYAIAVHVSTDAGRQKQFRDLAELHARSAVILSDRAFYDKYSDAALIRLRRELKEDKAGVTAVVRRNVEYCDGVSVRHIGLLAERSKALRGNGNGSPR